MTEPTHRERRKTLTVAALPRQSPAAARTGGAAVSAKARRRNRRPPRRLSAAEIAEIDELIVLDGGGTDEQREWERLNCLRLDQDKLQELFRASPTTPWPKQVGPGPTSGRDGFLYVREADGLPEAQLAHVVEIARRDGLIRYALAPGEPGIDPDQYWRKRDPSWHFVMARLRGVPPDDIDRVIDKAVDDLLDSNIPPSQGTKQFIKADRQKARDPKRRERDRDRALALTIAGQLDSLTELLAFGPGGALRAFPRDSGFKDARTRAAEYLAVLWRKIVQEDRGRSRFSSGPALAAWLRRHRDPTENTPKMSCQRERSEHSDDR
jgi:hypothetical protein